MTSQGAPRHDLDDEDLGLPRGPSPGDRGLFVLRSVLRNRLLATAVLAGSVFTLVVYYALKLPLYRVETTILAQRQQALPSMIRSNVTEDVPTRAAWEIIHRRENLVDLAGQAGLIDRVSQQPLAGQALDRLMAGASHLGDPRLATDTPLDRLVLLLDRRLVVTTREGTITIQIEWPDPQQAFRLVEGALQNFLEARHLQEVTALDEAISLLQGRAAVARTDLAKIVEEARRSAYQDASRAPRQVVIAAPAAATPAQQSEELARLRSLLEAKERAIGDVEEFRRRRLADLQAQYDARRAVYSDSHPEMLTLRQDIAALSRDSPQIALLRDEERRLRREFQDRQSAENASAPPPVAPTTPAPSRPTSEGLSAAVEQNERVREARFRFQQMVDRVNAAQVELDTARAAFKHRYTIVWPAQVPTRPVSPNPWKIFGLGGLAAILLTFLACAAADVRRGRILERWQIERGLGLPILAEFRRR